MRTSLLAIAAAAAAFSARPSTAQTFSNLNNIFIPDSGPSPLYPSVIHVSGITSPVESVSISLGFISHSYPDDVDVLVVGPQGQAVIIWSDAGGEFDINNTYLTFADGAPPLPDQTFISSGTYAPTNYVQGDTFPAPAPPGPYAAALSVFNGTDPNGDWRIFVFDDAASDLGNIGLGWSINITASSTPAQPAPTAVTYQGRLSGPALRGGGTPVDLRFSLYPAPSAGLLIAGPVEVDGVVPTSSGEFSVPVDFGPDGFAKDARWLEIEARPAGGDWITLSPRQPITPVPQARWAAGVTIPSPPTSRGDLTNLLPFGAFGNGYSTAENTDPVAFQRLNFSPDRSTLFLILGNEDQSLIDSFSIGTLYIGQDGNSSLYERIRFGASGDAQKPGGGSWSVLSDPRAKRDIAPMKGTLNKLLSLRGYSYNYTDEFVAKGAALPGRQLGLMADEVECVFPDWVGTGPDGLKFVTERSTTALMVEALRDLRAEKDAQIAELEAQNAKLRADHEQEMLQLKSRLERLEHAASNEAAK